MELEAIANHLKRLLKEKEVKTGQLIYHGKGDHPHPKRALLLVGIPPDRIREERRDESIAHPQQKEGSTIFLVGVELPEGKRKIAGYFTEELGGEIRISSLSSRSTTMRIETRYGALLVLADDAGKKILNYHESGGVKKAKVTLILPAKEVEGGRAEPIEEQRELWRLAIDIRKQNREFRHAIDDERFPFPVPQEVIDHLKELMEHLGISDMYLVVRGGQIQRARLEEIRRMGVVSAESQERKLPIVSISMTLGKEAELQNHHMDAVHLLSDLLVSLFSGNEESIKDSLRKIRRFIEEVKKRQ